MKSTRLAKKLGGELRNGWVDIPGPGHSECDRSLGVRLCKRARGGFYVNSLAGDDPKICRAYVKARLWGLAKRRRIIEDEPVDNDEGNSIGALRVWSEGEPIVGTPAAVYLTSRGCAPTTGISWPTDLRFHPGCPFGPYRFPALIALTRDVVTGEPTGIHRTALSDDGSSKRVMPVGLSSKMTLGCAAGAAIHLSNAGTRLGLAEGIETALSAEKIFKVPVWAALSASGISSFPVVHGLSRLFVFADNDDPGLKAARTCKRRYGRAGIEAQIRYPAEHETDWNDHLRKG